MIKKVKWLESDIPILKDDYYSIKKQFKELEYNSLGFIYNITNVFDDNMAFLEHLYTKKLITIKNIFEIGALSNSIVFKYIIDDYLSFNFGAWLPITDHIKMTKSKYIFSDYSNKWFLITY
jgi:hypothetical protein